MRLNIDNRLERLKARRRDDQNAALMARGFVENFENRTPNKSTKYALGAMEEVDHRSTQISHEEADRVEGALVERLTKHGIRPEFRMQGSVPMNVHIRGVSDVDLLEIHRVYLTYSILGPAANTYTPLPANVSVIEEVISMRNLTEYELQKHFWGAFIDTKNAKSIQISEGSFRRKVDVVPSHWFDSDDYQRYNREVYRGVSIVNKFTKESSENFPFLFRHHIEEKSLTTNGGAKMAIRLCKNIKSDQDEDNALSSYDIASVIFHCPEAYIINHTGRELSVLAGTQRWFQELSQNRDFTEKLITPDGTRKIIDDTRKWYGLCTISRDLTELAEEVTKEVVNPYLYRSFDMEDMQKSLNEVQIPILPNF